MFCQNNLFQVLSLSLPISLSLSTIPLHLPITVLFCCCCFDNTIQGKPSRKLPSLARFSLLLFRYQVNNFFFVFLSLERSVKWNKRWNKNWGNWKYKQSQKSTTKIISCLQISMSCKIGGKSFKFNKFFKTLCICFQSSSFSFV